MRLQQLLRFPPAFVGLWIGATLAAEDSPPPTPVGNGEAPSTDRARKLAAQFKYAEAASEYQALILVDEKLYGPQNEQTLNDRLALAVVEVETGESLKAESEMRTLLAIFARRHGPDQDQTLRCRTDLANLLFEVGRPHEAVKEYREVVDSRERVLGPDDIEVARVRHSLGDALATTGDYPGAISEYGKAAIIFERVLGPQDPETLHNRSNRALSEFERQEFDSAEKELKEVLEIGERRLGENDVSVLRTCFDLGRVLAGHKHDEEALDYAVRAETGLRSAFGDANPFVIRAAHLTAEIRAHIALAKAVPNPTK